MLRSNLPTARLGAPRGSGLPPWMVIVALLAMPSIGCADPGATTVPAVSDAGVSVSVEARSGYWPTYPCTQCHEHAPGTANARVRELVTFHTHTNDMEHGDLAGWCYQCHAQANLDELRLPDGRHVGFDESYELCGGCHGEKAVDWRAGIHGLTTGQWNGAQLRRSCTHCHDPHQSKLAPMAPAPLVPDYQRRAPASEGPRP